ncbi:relaxase/mobilization nuclease domain-containing protein [Clostridium estertheticum]|uniref:relaxase/mobilization nuclease domain-containing protein n=1 Tax=Clostridium estertheticum TaxID=238834 RepID=UPI001C7CFE4B|nr:relaxase/mobilization nuclease domain-containing protein [Clostridium estertheticum]MBX4267143.1 relaxase/mobilization nuclease domain-containing protein [Clostridium estertheticum]MBX4272218.1 relaxase/mobilization nuclease domain-containing protein [Clostridium estertheticum]WLC82446.1 relaxase/mobilization nuclease domain-containing protein [Clostridium estertheticum]WLC91320.1 relaxase/mobilization nuclease domain-containing protein [Clostridium estertheticum]
MSSGAIGKAISNIHNNVIKSLEYITNPDKTEKQLLVSGIHCYKPDDSKKTGKEFKETYNKFSKKEQANKKPIVAHHYLISFDPNDNINSQKSHELSREIINRFLKNEHQVVLSTHIDKEKHIHTHIIFNTYNKNKGKKYESSPAKLKEFKEIINEVCLEHKLNLINKPNFGEKKVDLNYREWLDSKNITDDKKISRFKYIREVIKLVLKDRKIDSLDKLSKVLKKRYNLNIKYKSYKTNKLYKNITFKSDDWEKSVRGKFDISLENIIAQLEGKNVKYNKFEEYCIEYNTTDHKKYIKNAIDEELKNNISILSIDDLAEVLQRKYNIEMKFLSCTGAFLKSFKFKALDSEQKNFIGAASLDKENRSNYEVKGIKDKISKLQEIKFGTDIRENLEILNKNFLISGKKDKWGISTGLNYMTKINLRSKNDIYIRHTRLSTVKNKNEVDIDKINVSLKEMELIYSRLKKKMIEVKSLGLEISELGIFNSKQKKELIQKTNNIKVEINQLKESEFYQKEMKYSEKSEKLNEEKADCVSILKECDNEFDLLYNIETINKDKEKILEELKRDQQEQEQQKKNFKKILDIDL